MIQLVRPAEINEAVYEMSNGGHFKISGDVIVRMAIYRQTGMKDTEAGGILMGRFVRESKNIIVDIITEPMQGDKRKRFSFKRLSPMHQTILDEEWARSKGTCNYLGEWHTHPEKIPHPSGVDTRDWRRKLKNDIFSSRYLYFLIVGIDEIAVWEADRRTLDLIKLTLNK